MCLTLGAQPAAAGSATPQWNPPTCGEVTGDGSVTFTWNAGRHLTPTSRAMTTGTIVSDLATLAAPDQLLAVNYAGEVTVSRDAGCTWTLIDTVEGSGPFAISPAPDGSAYVWAKHNGDRLYRVAGDAATELPTLPVDGYGMLALTADPLDADHLRAVTRSGAVLDSKDGGRTFQLHGKPPTPEQTSSVYGYAADIAPEHLDRIVLGTMVDGVFASHDGGLTWAKATMGGPGHRVNAFSLAVSPADPSVVWAMALDITEMNAGSPAQGRHIYRSTDGGRSFRPAVDHVPGQVTLTNGLPLVAHPVDAERVYFVFGDWWSNYGTDLFSYHAGLDQLTLTHNGYDDVLAIAFHPRMPSLMYLGLAEER